MVVPHLQEKGRQVGRHAIGQAGRRVFGATVGEVNCCPFLHPWLHLPARHTPRHATCTTAAIIAYPRYRHRCHRCHRSWPTDLIPIGEVEAAGKAVIGQLVKHERVDMEVHGVAGWVAKTPLHHLSQLRHGEDGRVGG